jgi:hypothetical protein
MEMLGLVFLTLFVGVTLIAMLTAIGLLLPLSVERARQKLELNTWKSFLVGLVNLIFWLVVVILFFVWTQANGGPQILAFVIALVLLILLFAAVIVPGIPALSALAQVLGARMGETKSPLRRDLRGGLLLVLACLTPYLGWFLFFPAILCTAIGAGLLALFLRNSNPSGLRRIPDLRPGRDTHLRRGDPMRYQILIVFFVLGLFVLACGQVTPTPAPVDRYSLVPDVKYDPESDFWPPTAIEGWTQPVPLPYPVNTSGGEDSPFILPDGQTLYYFFTPDVSIPAEQQLLDGVTGIWVSHRSGETWSEPERVQLSDPGTLSLDGCEFVSGDLMYFCTAREGYSGIQWFRADFRDGLWQDWRYAGDELKQSEYEVGELHISSDGQELYFHSSRAGGYGGVDIWVSQMTPEGWGEPVNLGPQVNTAGNDGWPYISADGQELWFNSMGWPGQTRPGPALFRSLRQPDGSWGQSEEIITTFAGEPTLSEDGMTLYFTHHYFSEDLSTMLEADIYVSYRVP